MVLGHFDPDGVQWTTTDPFPADSRAFVWRREYISDLASDGREYRWETAVCVPAASDHPGKLWSPAYSARSKELKRISASTSAHARRVRLESATIERFDPFEIYERDGWVCGLCGVPVPPELNWPDPMSASLDHIMPLSAGGDHSRANAQLAHWICNVRKGASWPLVSDP